MTFQEAEQQYQQLLRQLNAGQISHPEFRSELDKLQVKGPDGIPWRLRPEDGAWLCWDGSSWVVTSPPAPDDPSVSPKRRRWWLACGVLLLLSCCCLILVGGGGFFALQASSISAMQFSTQLSGTAQVNVANLDDHNLTVRYLELDVPADEADADSIQLDTYDTSTFTSLAPGRYALEFVSDGNDTLNINCSIHLENRDELQFVAVPAGLAIARAGDNVTDPAELDAATSSLCRQ